MAREEVRVGQVWADNDPRAAGRILRVDAIDGDKAVCTALTNRADSQVDIDSGSPWVQDTRGRQVRIALRRFRPTSTGYWLVSEGGRP